MEDRTRLIQRAFALEIQHWTRKAIDLSTVDVREVPYRIVCECKTDELQALGFVRDSKLNEPFAGWVAEDGRMIHKRSQIFDIYVVTVVKDGEELIFPRHWQPAVV